MRLIYNARFGIGEYIKVIEKGFEILHVPTKNLELTIFICVDNA